MTDNIADWIGHERAATDVVTPRLVAEFQATLGNALCATGDLLGLEWCLSPDIFPAEKLGRDCHPRLGLTLPDLDLPRRMWAGGKITSHGQISVGETIERKSTIRDIKFKDGRSGKLAFVSVEHSHSCGSELRLSEIQNIVYREDPDEASGAAQISPPQAEQWQPIESRQIETSPTLLFRYSAITFNGHRIHYDLPYSTSVEGYDGLVVHGPLQSIWMQHLARDIMGRTALTFSYRGLSPLICNRAACVEARHAEQGLELRVRDTENNVVTMSATAT